MSFRDCILNAGREGVIDGEESQRFQGLFDDYLERQQMEDHPQQDGIHNGARLTNLIALSRDPFSRSGPIPREIWNPPKISSSGPALLGMYFMVNHLRHWG